MTCGLAGRCSLLALTLICIGCAEHQPAATADSTLDNYFRRFCGYTGNMGIGLDASQTNDWKFRQRLAGTDDAELKRLFVVYHLYAEVEQVLSDVEDRRSETMLGNNHDMTDAECDKLCKEVANELSDLSRFDPGDPEGAIGEARNRLEKLHSP